MKANDKKRLNRLKAARSPTEDYRAGFGIKAVVPGVARGSVGRRGAAWGGVGRRGAAGRTYFAGLSCRQERCVGLVGA